MCVALKNSHVNLDYFIYLLIQSLSIKLFAHYVTLEKFNTMYKYKYSVIKNKVPSRKC